MQQGGVICTSFPFLLKPPKLHVTPLLGILGRNNSLGDGWGYNGNRVNTKELFHVFCCIQALLNPRFCAINVVNCTGSKVHKHHETAHHMTPLIICKMVKTGRKFLRVLINHFCAKTSTTWAIK